MKKEDLRIGNYINIHETFVQMEIIDFNFSSSFMNPIILTKEWLIKFGFVFSIDTWYLTGFAIWETECGDKKGNEYMGFFYELREVGMMDRQIKYIHELQNLYFALKGEELTIKEL